MPRDAVDTAGLGRAAALREAYRGRAGRGEAGDDESPGDGLAGVEGPEAGGADGQGPQQRAFVSVAHVVPDERDEGGEGDERVEAEEGALAEGGDEARAPGRARERHVGGCEERPEQRDREPGRHQASPCAAAASARTASGPPRSWRSRPARLNHRWTSPSSVKP